MYLTEILQHHREIDQRDNRDLDVLTALAISSPPTRGFETALRLESGTRLAVIAEIKRRSPSRGALNQDLDPAATAVSYQTGGATCISVLTDQKFFGGSIEDLTLAKDSVSLPTLRKDFTVGLRDICDARIMGADCLLLIAAALKSSEINDLHKFAKLIGIDVLVEVHDEYELEVAIEIGATMIGVNQRDLKTFEVDRRRAIAIAKNIPPGVIKIAESGVSSRHDALSLRDAGFDAVLVGEHLVTAADIQSAVNDLRV